MTEYTDPYAVSGELLDIMIAGWWEHHGPAVVEAARDLPADAGPVVDAGTGGGWGARLLARPRMGDIRPGKRTYSGWARAEPDGPERVTWQMTYEVREGDRLVSRSEVRYPWWTVSESSLRAETEPHGLGVTPQGPGDAGLYRIGRVVG